MTSRVRSIGSFAFALTIALFAIGSGTASADPGEAIVRQNCAACHSMDAAAIAGSGIQERVARKGPPLDHAGNKYRQDWLAQWLHQPDRIRPAGTFPPGHTVAGEKGDRIDENSLSQHPALPAKDATAVATFLMGLRSKDVVVADTTYTPRNAPARIAQMNFRKFKGCIACHSDERGVGGVSGPELYTAWQRLQPEYMVSYIANPVEWDPHTMMPNRHINADEAQKLVDYFRQIGGEK